MISDVAVELAAQIKAIRAQDDKRVDWMNVSVSR